MDRLPLGPVYKHCRWAVLAGAWPWVVTWGRSGAHRAQALAERSLCSSSKHSPSTKRALVSHAHTQTNTRTVAERVERMGCAQERLRDMPLVELRQPLLFVRGTRDNFCEDAHFKAVRARLASPRVEVGRAVPRLQPHMRADNLSSFSRV